MAEGTGSKLEDFRLMCKLGEGTFSEVLKVKHKKSGKIYAMKRFRKHFQSTEEIEGLREIQALRRLNPHQNVIDLEDVIFDPKHGILSLNFDLMDCNLYELISKKHSPITEVKSKVYMHQICKGLEYMHSKGIFHRDIKPENILIKDSVVKIGDFGSCRGIHSKQPYTEYIATRWYRSPECLLCDGIYNFKMDIWGAGCVLYEMITRVPLFPGANELDQLHRIHAVLGTPSQKTLKLMLGSRANQLKFQFPQKEGSGIRPLLPQVSTECVDLIIALLAYMPDDRLASHLENKEEEVSNPVASTTTHNYLKAPKQKSSLPPQAGAQSDSGSNAGVGAENSLANNTNHASNHDQAAGVKLKDKSAISGVASGENGDNPQQSAFLQKFKREMDEKRAAEAALARARKSKRHLSNGPAAANGTSSNAQQANATSSARGKRSNPNAGNPTAASTTQNAGYKLPSLNPDRSAVPGNAQATSVPRNLPVLNPQPNVSDAEKGPRNKQPGISGAKESVTLPSLTNGKQHHDKISFVGSGSTDTSNHNTLPLLKNSKT
ncbi:hypothetical protein HDU67_000341 [Dinochytrium kinnereticum]|nr:hypothetical protein HDU67_000341 [Dinochytrium kinnereticum]